MKKYDFKQGDWIICYDAASPKAYRFNGIIDDYGIYLDLPHKGSFSRDNKCLRLAYQSEIPLEFRNKQQYYFY